MVWDQHWNAAFKKMGQFSPYIKPFKNLQQKCIEYIMYNTVALFNIFSQGISGACCSILQPVKLTSVVGNCWRFCRSEISVFWICLGNIFVKVIALKQIMFISLKKFTYYFLDKFIILQKSIILLVRP